MTVIYSDVELSVVDFFKTALVNEPTVRVGVKKADPNIKPYPTEELVITVGYGRQITTVTKNSTITLDVYAVDYDRADYLGRLIEAYARDLISVDAIYYAEVTLGPVRTAEPSTAEKRSISVDIIIKAETL